MRRPKAYPGIDAFRLVAALLVVAIHTAPLSDLSPTADFILPGLWRGWPYLFSS